VSLSAQLTVFSRLVIIGVMVAGRHRGLPESIDPTVKIPDLPEGWLEEEEAQHRHHSSIVARGLSSSLSTTFNPVMSITHQRQPGPLNPPSDTVNT